MEPTPGIIPAKELASPRETYLARRKFVEQSLLANPLTENNFNIQDGTNPLDVSKIKVLSGIVKIPDHLKKASVDGLKRVTVYVPGLFDATKPNFGNHPLEAKLASSLLTGDVDSLVVLKGEGLNNNAYREYEDGKKSGINQQKVAGSAVEILKNRLQEIREKENENVEFTILGFSEGSTQGASIAAEILRKGLGTVKEFVSIGGGGLAGEDFQENASPLPIVTILKNTLASKKIPKPQFPAKNNEGANQYHSVDDEGNIEISPKLLGDKKQGGLEESLGRARVETADDFENVIKKFGGRAFRSILFGEEEIPTDRIRSMLTINSDYEELAKKGIPISIFSGLQDNIFNHLQVKENAIKLKREGGNVLFISSDVGHSFAHENPSGVAYALEAFKHKTKDSKSSLGEISAGSVVGDLGI